MGFTGSCVAGFSLNLPIAVSQPSIVTENLSREVAFVTCCVTYRYIVTSFSSRILDGVSSMWTSLEKSLCLCFLAGLLLSRLS